VFHVAKFAEAIYVLHAFGKTTAQTRKAELDLARHRYQELVHLRRGRAQAARNRRK
jgi:phage-related protein